MLTAYLYHRGDRTLKHSTLRACGSRSPPHPQKCSRKTAHQFSLNANGEDDEHHEEGSDDGEHAPQEEHTSQGKPTTHQEHGSDAEGSRAPYVAPTRHDTDEVQDFHHNEAGHNGAGGGGPQGNEHTLVSQPSKNGKKNGIKGAFRGTTSRCRAGELLWVDISAPTEADYQLLIDRFALHPMVIEDLKAREGRPKLHDYGEYLYIIFHALSREREDGDEKTQGDEWLLSHTQTNEPRVVLKIQEIDCLVGSDYAITLHPEEVKPFEDLKKRWKTSPDLMRAGSSQLLYELMDEVLDEYFPLLDDFDMDVNQLEEQLFDVGSSGQTQKQQHRTSSDIFAFKRALVQVRRIAGPTRDIANVLLRRDAEAGGKHFAYYQDLYDHASRIVDMVDTFRDILSGLHDSYLAMASNRMNEVMKTLTSASIMLLIPGLIAGIYGMNFDHMPELHSRNGYFITLGVMVTIVVTLFGVFKKIDWL